MVTNCHQLLVSFEHKKTQPKLGHPKNYEKNMKTLANRIRKLLAYLYYSKKAAQAQA